MGISYTFSITPSALGKDEDARTNNLVSLIDGYVAKGGHHININVFDRVFVQGCPLRCSYCHNPDTWNTKNGNSKSIDELVRQIDDYSMFIQSGGVTVSGGEPLLQPK